MTMNRMKLIAGAAAVAATSILLVGCEDSIEGAVNGSKESTSSSYDITEKVTSINLDNKGGDIQLTASDSTVIKVTEEVTYTSDKPATEHKVSGGELRLTAGSCDKGNCGVRYRIEMPRTVSVKISSDGGDVTGRGLAADTDLSTEGGQVNLVFSKAPNTVEASTAGGDVTVTVPSGSYAVDASTDGGERSVTVQTDSSSTHRIKLRTDGGDVTVKPGS
ncbi:hypothetical protein SUDANB21_05718 [Streptomyces sp. enrichment culture]